ncbi:histone-lysine N-methyltransferase ATX2-like [Rutidosis leptorrhynchoides]|uniref:histone-lysine N-methyltransferase ATX2-like n=1 Tax=Rutidosis leptorrhynchoides TaxID=125765 RepID=UPI003A99305D
MIKVWWPLDKMYYKGVVSSYDSITDRYEVLYLDGYEELLDLRHEKWIILDNLINDPFETPDVSFASKKRVAKHFRGKKTPKKWKRDLVGCTIKVWWPLDKKYYKGVVSSYDGITDRYEVLYADGDEEMLNLHHEKWMIHDNPKIYPLQFQTPDVSSDLKSIEDVERNPIEEMSGNETD